MESNEELKNLRRVLENLKIESFVTIYDNEDIPKEYIGVYLNPDTLDLIKKVFSKFLLNKNIIEISTFYGRNMVIFNTEDIKSLTKWFENAKSKTFEYSRIEKKITECIFNYIYSFTLDSRVVSLYIEESSLYFTYTNDTNKFENNRAKLDSINEVFTSKEVYEYDGVNTETYKLEYDKPKDLYEKLKKAFEL